MTFPVSPAAASRPSIRYFGAGARSLPDAGNRTGDPCRRPRRLRIRWRRRREDDDPRFRWPASSYVHFWTDRFVLRMIPRSWKRLGLEHAAGVCAYDSGWRLRQPATPVVLGPAPLLRVPLVKRPEISGRPVAGLIMARRGTTPLAKSLRARAMPRQEMGATK